MISKTYCPLPFNHLYIHPNNKASVCCGFQKLEEKLPFIQEYDNLSDHLKHPFMKDIQQKMLKGEKIKGCATCYYAEEHGYKSMRQKELETWHDGNFIPPVIDNPKLEYLEVTFGNYCNLACRTCGSDLSHSWIKDEIMLRENNESNAFTITRMDIDREWQDDDLKDLQYLKITGGEPMLHPDFPKFISKLDQKNIEIFIFTNASWVPKKRILDMLYEFKHCAVFVSIDGIGTIQEYMRHNSIWDTTEKSVTKWLEFMKGNHHLSIAWAPTWSLMNASNYIDICNWWLNITDEVLDYESSKCGLFPTNFLYWPKHYQMGLLSNKDELKAKAEEYINELKANTHYTKQILERIIEMTEAYIKFFNNDMSKHIQDLEKYYKVTGLLDKSRNQSLKEMIPLAYESMYNRV